MDYGNLIGEAFRIAWRNRYLWFFGFFISGGATSFNISVPPNPEAQTNTTTSGLPTWLTSLGQWAQQNVVLAVALGAVLLVLLLIVFVGLALISAGGLVESVAGLDRGGRRNFASTWQAGIRNSWRVFLYGVLFFLIGLVPVIVIGGPVALGIFGIVAATESVGLRILLISIVALVAFVLLMVISIALSLIQQLALRELVIGGRGITASIDSGYRLFRRNLGRVLVVWLIQIGLALAAVAVISIIGFVVGITQNLGFIALSYAAPYPLVVGLAVVAGLILSLPFIVLYAVFGVFNHAYWTLAYLRLADGPAPQDEYAPRTTG